MVHIALMLPWRGPATFVAYVTLVDVASGEATLTREYPLKGRRLTVALGRTIVQDVQGALAPAETTLDFAAGAGPALDFSAGEAPPLSLGGDDAPPGPDAAVASDMAVSTPTQEEEPAPPDASSQQEPEPPTETGDSTIAKDTAPATSTPGSDAASESKQAAAEDASATAPTPAPTPTGSPEAPSQPTRSALEITLGASAIMRTGKLSAQDEAGPSHGEPDGGVLPVFRAGALQLRLYPLAFGRTGAWYEGIGVHVDALASPGVPTLINATSNEKTKTFVLIANAGFSMRWILGRSSAAPDVELLAGACRYSYPLKKAAFPGIVLDAPYAGAKLNVTIAETLQLSAGARYVPLIQVSQGKKQLGKPKSGSGLRAEAAVGLLLRPVVVRFLGRLDTYSVLFRGPTALNSPRQYVNVELTDRIFSGLAAVGITF